MAMNMTENNKAGWQALPNKFYEIGVGDIQKYLEDDVLGFKIACDWERWTGITSFVGYMRMRVVIAPKNIEVPMKVMDYADRTLRDVGGDRMLNKSVTDALQPFMYPANMHMLYLEQNRSMLKHMNELGIVGNKLDELVHYSKITLARDRDTGRQYYITYLRPERILFDGLTNAETNKIEGQLYIRRIYGEEQKDFKFLIERVISQNTVTDDLSVDQIFALR